MQYVGLTALGWALPIVLVAGFFGPLYALGCVVVVLVIMALAYVVRDDDPGLDINGDLLGILENAGSWRPPAAQAAEERLWQALPSCNRRILRILNTTAFSGGVVSVVIVFIAAWAVWAMSKGW
jgi:hypothetical protein